MSDPAATPQDPAVTPQDPAAAPANPAEDKLSPAEKEALSVARNGLPPVDPHAKPDNRPQRPEGVPEKFWDADKGEVRVDALTQSYAELESKLSAKPAEPAEEGEGDDVEVKHGKISKKAEAEAEEGEQENPVTGLISTAATEFSSDGAFSEETAASLAEAGIPPEVQQVYLAGLEALQEKQTSAVHGYVGGEEQYNAMAKWAGQTLSDAELEAFNTALDNPALAENAVTGLFARFSKARPNEGRKVTPQNGATDAGDIFNSRDELVSAMSDQRYRSDPVYQREVAEKMRRTRKAGMTFNSK